MTREQLAAEVIRVLDLRVRYDHTRDTQQRLEYRAAERKLREACHGVLHPEQEQPQLFGDDGGG